MAALGSWALRHRPTTATRHRAHWSEDRLAKRARIRWRDPLRPHRLHIRTGARNRTDPDSRIRRAVPLLPRPRGTARRDVSPGGGRDPTLGVPSVLGGHRRRHVSRSGRTTGRLCAIHLRQGPLTYARPGRLSRPRRDWRESPRERLLDAGSDSAVDVSGWRAGKERRAGRAIWLRAWLGYRGADCFSMSDMFEGGTEAGAVDAQCVAGRNTQRLRDLRCFHRALLQHG